MLYPDVQLRTAPGIVTLERDDVGLTFTGCDPAKVIAAASSLDGADQDVSEHSLAALVAREAVAAGMARALDGRAEVTGRELHAVCQALFPAWKERVFGHRLWVALAAGAATRSQFRGWVLETYHFIQAANERLPLAVSHCEDGWVRGQFVHHYTEEFDHGAFFLRSLATLGIDEHNARASRPLPGTFAVMNQMRRAARLDWLAYAACSGFLESTGADRERALEFFDQVGRHYGKDAVEPMIAHVRLDEQYGHGNLFEGVCARLGRIELDRASLAITTVLDLVEALVLWAEDTATAYSERCVPPRDLYRYRGAV